MSPSCCALYGRCDVYLLAFNCKISPKYADLYYHLCFDSRMMHHCTHANQVAKVTGNKIRAEQA